MNNRKKVPREFLRNDSGNAELFASLYRDAVLFDHKQQRWLTWEASKGRWVEDRTGRVYEFAKDAARTRVTLALSWPRGTDQERASQIAEIKWAINSQSLYRIKAALELAKCVPSMGDTGEGWDSDPWMLGVANGVVDLRTGKLRPGTQQDLFTKFSPVEFDPSATCPRFERFLNEIFNGDAALISYMQRMIGYCLTGSGQEQCVFCWYGSGANGKTTLSVVLRYIFGDYAVNLPFSALEMKNRNSNDLVALAGARLATAAETNEGVRLNEARLKMLTGGDPITARRLYQESFTFQPTHKLVLAFNHKPVIADDSEGMWRRMRLIPFTRQFKPEEQDKNLLDELKAEGPGILAWTVRGCMLWQEQGLGMPPAIAEATAAYREESDHLGEFIEDCCVVEASATVTSGMLWKRYQEWADEYEEVPLSRGIFAERLEKRGFRRDRCGHGGTRSWVGIGLCHSKAPQSSASCPSNGDRVTQGDTTSDNFPMSGDIGEFSKSASPSVTTSPAAQADAGIERLLENLGNEPGLPIDWNARQPWERRSRRHQRGNRGGA